MNKEEAIKRFNEGMPGSEVFKRTYYEISDLFEGEFAEGQNYYELPSGIVVSRELLQGKEKNPTVGRIWRSSERPLDFELKSGYTETMMVLEGQLRASVRTPMMSDKFNGEDSVLKKFGSITAGFGTTLRLQPETDDVLYLCMYKRIKPKE